MIVFPDNIGTFRETFQHGTIMPRSLLSKTLVQDRPGIAVVSISRMQTLCEMVTPRYQEQARIIGIREGYGVAVNAVQTQVDAGMVDVVLAAGSNGAYLRDHLSVPVVLVKANSFDVLGAITKATLTWPSASIGLVLHESIVNELDGLSPWLAIRLFQRAYRSIDEVHNAVKELAAQGCSVIIGPGMACDIAEQSGLETLFLYSLRAVEEAFDRSIELARISRQKETKRARLNTIIAHLRDGVAAFDETGELEAFNPAMFSLLGLNQEIDSPATLVQKVAPFVQEQVKRRAAIEERIEHIDGRTLIVNCLPIMEYDKRTGAVVAIQDAQVAQRVDRSLRTRYRPGHLVARHELDDLIGDSAMMEKVRRVARASAIHDATVLLTGESGTGKELVAQGIHNASRRRDNPFVAFNCAALPEALIESELFGYEEGAFTGAKRTGKPGLFEIAHSGTIFLDEVGEMQPALQARLLRVLQERELMKLGADRATPVDVRVIAATHRDLHQLVEQGMFRRDLYFRLNLLQIRLPALRDRPGDMLQLARHLLDRIVAQYHFSKDVPSRVLEWLAPLIDCYTWPGNVRELENLLTRAAVHMSDPENNLTCDSDDIFPEFERVTAEKKADTVQRATVTREDVIRALEQCGGNRAAASRLLGIGRTSLWRIMKE